MVTTMMPIIPVRMLPIVMAMPGIHPNNDLPFGWFRCRSQRKGKEHTDSQNPVSHNTLHRRFSLIAN
jgi:hypothetical protein